MKITLESTSEIGTIEVRGVLVPARLWCGQTESGIPILAFITRLGVPDGHDPAEFERELLEPPTVIGVEPHREVTLGPCRRCSECVGEDHHWLEYVGYACKHCEVSAPADLVERLMGLEGGAP